MLPAEQMDALIEQIGDELLLQLKLAPPKAASSVAACACGSAANPLAGVGSSGAPAVGWARSLQEISARIDSTLLKPEATESDILRLCREARALQLGAVCVQPYWVARAVREFQGPSSQHRPKVATVVGFPHGATLTPAKCAEAATAIRVGAQEIDMLASIPALIAGDLDAIYGDIRAVVEIAHSRKVIVKVILETGLLSDEQKINGCVVAKLAGADFVKTSTGFGPSGANAQDVALMRRAVGDDLGVKAAGGIHGYDTLKVMAAAGASRIGTSHAAAIIEQARASLSA